MEANTPNSVRSLPAPPRCAPGALPDRSPSGDWAADATEKLLAKVVDPFGENDEVSPVSAMTWGVGTAMAGRALKRSSSMF
jgi:hypothetical protein